jgi:DNA-binding LacI/PurR family transcriptional regulator
MNVHNVAARARVSPATVSRVLNNSIHVDPATRARVLQVVEELNYQPNANARALSSRSNRTLGVIVSNLNNPYFLDIYQSMEDVARSDGYELLVANTCYERDRLTRELQMILGRRVAGLAALVSELDSQLLAQLEALNIPVVISGVQHGPARMANIRVDWSKGMHTVVRHLYGLGHRSMAFVDHHATLECIAERRATFLKTTQALGLSNMTMAFTHDDTFEGGRRAVRDIEWQGPNRPTAVICVNDTLAVGVLRELRETGFRVPEDISVTGFNNIDLSQYVTPALTTVHVPRAEIGRLAFRSLVDEKMFGKEILVEPELIFRASTGPRCSSGAVLSFSRAKDELR